MTACRRGAFAAGGGGMARRLGAAAIMGLAVAAALPAKDAPRERLVPADGLVAARVGGAAMTIRIDPAMIAMPMLDSAHAALAGLKPGPFAMRFAVGPRLFTGHTAVAPVVLPGAAPFKRRIGWAVQARTAGIAGAIGPGGLPEPLVRFTLRPPIAGERTVTLPMMKAGGLFGDWGASDAMILVGGQPMRLRFDPHHPRTLATAGAAVRLAAAQGGTLSGAPAPVEIAFGIARPVRTLTLARPLAIGPLQLAVLGARTGDYGRTSAIAEAEPDPDELVVVARGKKADPARDRLNLGADMLARCSSILFDKPARRITLTCA